MPLAFQQQQVMQVLVDIGTDDNFLKEQLEPEALKSAAQGKLKLELRMQVSSCAACVVPASCHC